MTSPFITERVLLRSSSLSTRTDAFGRFPHSDFANLISCARLCSSFFIAFCFAWAVCPRIVIAIFYFLSNEKVNPKNAGQERSGLVCSRAQNQKAPWL